MFGWLRQRLREVPWRHVWILILAALLVVLALFGLFHHSRTSLTARFRPARVVGGIRPLPPTAGGSVVADLAEPPPLPRPGGCRGVPAGPSQDCFSNTAQLTR